ncbi:LacI family DNA-binding transcriptional regulator [Serratia proteamaculans]|uniref:substrate-binding domain-containing protein n=1 Tax=Serratia proteamaculans TaxID=28151 RepID=UPI001076ABEE|nr:substrate-binding domain-containing protein [Serratia proteamaculans]TFZ51129.1 LacI family DNA-binding transcriptional regulator [Serratia proteamaculans]
MSDLISVAKLAGVSRATAARAFSAPSLLRPETLSKVLAASRQLGFRPNRVAQQLRTQSTRILGVVVPTFSNPVFAEQLQAMEVIAQQQGYSLLVATTDYQPENEVRIVESLLRQRVDGLILTVADAENSRVLTLLEQEDIPVVLVHNPAVSAGVPSVCVDNYRAMYDVTTHLLQLGHHHIGMLTGPMWQSDRARLRYQGHQQAMRDGGLASLPVIEMPGHTRSHFSRLEPYLQGPQALTALLCSNDLLALSTIGGLMRAGYRVPDQVSVVGFDGIALGQSLFPSLCSVVQPQDELGRTAITNMLALLAGDPPGNAVIPHHLRLGESLGRPPAQTGDDR